MAELYAGTPEPTPSPIADSVPTYDVDPSTGITWATDPETGQPIAPAEDTRPTQPLGDEKPDFTAPPQTEDEREAELRGALTTPPPSEEDVGAEGVAEFRRS